MASGPTRSVTVKLNFNDAIDFTNCNGRKALQLVKQLIEGALSGTGPRATDFIIVPGTSMVNSVADGNLSTIDANALEAYRVNNNGSCIVQVVGETPPTGVVTVAAGGVTVTVDLETGLSYYQAAAAIVAAINSHSTASRIFRALVPVATTQIFIDSTVSYPLPGSTLLISGVNFTVVDTALVPQWYTNPFYLPAIAPGGGDSNKFSIQWASIINSAPGMAGTLAVKVTNPDANSSLFKFVWLGNKPPVSRSFDTALVGGATATLLQWQLQAPDDSAPYFVVQSTGANLTVAVTGDPLYLPYGATLFTSGGGAGGWLSQVTF